MPTVIDNVKKWEKRYRWKQKGDEWSAPWGGTDNLWYGTIFSRIKGFVPCHTILELAPGYGRCTQFLIRLCFKLYGVDISSKCIAECITRLKDYQGFTGIVNDGKSLDSIPDNSIDFVFSWDSMVHVEIDVLQIYLNQLKLKMKQGATGFIHHSNFGTFVDPASQKPIKENKHWRASSVSSIGFRNACSKAGIVCVSQELINWRGTDFPIDCLSFFVNRDDLIGFDTRISMNLDFHKEATDLRRRGCLYGIPEL